MLFRSSFKAALDLRDLLLGLERARAEMERIQKRLDVIIAVANDELETRRQNGSMRIDELMENIEGKFTSLRERIKLTPSDFLEDIREEIAELRGKYTVEKERRGQFGRLKDFYQRNLIKGNPGMYSKRFSEALEELKKVANERIDRKK